MPAMSPLPQSLPIKGREKAARFSMPAEWEPHEAIWLAWPHDADTFLTGIEKAEKVYFQIIKAIHTSEKVNLLILNQEMESRVSVLLQKHAVDLSEINFWRMDYLDGWMRDCGPIFVVNDQTKEVAITKWVFNAWGSKYPELLIDNEIPYEINKKLKLRMFEPGIILEGGSIEINSKGVVLTTEQCLLNKNRNPSLTKEQIEGYLKRYLGAEKIIWLKEGIAGDDTDGHIDDIARFVNDDTVLCGFEDDKSRPNYGVLKKSYDILIGERFKVTKLPMPEVKDKQGNVLPASYANFYIGNTKVLVPTFSHDSDAAALEIIQMQFPDREVVGIESTDLVYGYGTIHCLSQQQPLI